jgi:zinc D-Ala-D-Ala carboxypeptidase
MQITENFSTEEFRCKGNCRGLKDTPEFRRFVDLLQYARNCAGIPFNINSGYRCESHNRAVGGVPNSSHLDSIAADIEADTNEKRWLILRSLIFVGFQRFGIGKTFIHVDFAHDKPAGLRYIR